MESSTSLAIYVDHQGPSSIANDSKYLREKDKSLPKMGWPADCSKSSHDSSREADFDTCRSNISIDVAVLTRKASW